MYPQGLENGPPQGYTLTNGKWMTSDPFHGSLPCLQRAETALR